MKKLTILLSVMLFGLIGLAQTDTTVFFETETVQKTYALIRFETEFKTIDTILYDQTQDSTFWRTSRWIRKDSIYVNPTTYRIREVQRRINQQGILQRKARLIRYSTRTITNRNIR